MNYRILYNATAQSASLIEKGTVRRYKGVNELPEALYLSAGSYTALVTAGDSVPASFETVYYKEERPFHIKQRRSYQPGANLRHRQYGSCRKI